MKVAFCTLGCKVNQYDTDAMREMFIRLLTLMILRMFML